MHPAGLPPDEPPRTSLPLRIGWFVLIWAASVAALGVVALAIRWALKP